MNNDLIQATTVVNLIAIVVYSQVMWDMLVNPSESKISSGFIIVICHSVLFINLVYMGIYQLTKLF